LKNGLPTKLTIFLIIASIIQVQAGPGSQGGKLSLELEGVTLEKALGEIESRSEYRFMCEYSQIPLQEKVTLKASNQNLDEVLTLLFKNMPIVYTDRV